MISIKNCTFQETQIFHQRSNVFLGIFSVRYKLGSIFYGEDGRISFSLLYLPIWVFPRESKKEKKKEERYKGSWKRKNWKCFSYTFSSLRNRNIWTAIQKCCKAFIGEWHAICHRPVTAAPTPLSSAAITFVASGCTPVVLASTVEMQNSWACH